MPALRPDIALWLAEADPKVAEMLEIAAALEGLNRHVGTHAAGVVIGEKPLWEYVPCFKQNDEIVTQFAKDEVEKVGLVKFDFLGLKTLTVIANAIRHVNTKREAEGEEPLFPASPPQHNLPAQQLPLLLNNSVIHGRAQLNGAKEIQINAVPVTR